VTIRRPSALKLAALTGLSWRIGSPTGLPLSAPIGPVVKVVAATLLIPMAIARPDKAWFYATVCTGTSVAGGLLGYLIGALLYDSIGLWLIQLYGYGNKVEAFREAYAQWGGWIILLKGLTPIPYKIVTIASGFAGYNVFLFVLLSIVARGMRFFLLAFLLNRYGAQARLIIEERLGFWVGAAAVLLVGGIVAALYLF
jgi:membrane protein YqaA with SNARE-associated domain